MTIDPEFRNIIPPLTTEERDALEQSIKADGCRDALVIWGDILIDGHNRYEICERLGVPYKTTEMEFADRNDAIMWIIKNQFARRNLSAYDRAKLALRLKPVMAEKAKKNSLQNLKKGNVPPDVQKSAPRDEKTRDIIAKAAGVSHDTIQKVEKIEQMATPEVKEQLQSGEMSINQAYNAVKKAEKEQEKRDAEEQIADQETNDNPPAILTIKDSVGLMLDEKADLLLTDPPYSTDVENVAQFAQSWLPAALSNIKPSGFAYVFIGAYPDELKAYLNTEIPDHMKLDQVLVWTYKNTLGNNPKDRYKLNWQACLFYRGIDAPHLNCPLTSEQWAVQEINAPDGRQGDRYHTWQKPMEIAERFIRHTTKPGDLVYDPFACTGTFLLAASKLGRRSYGIEIDKDNAEIAIKRGCVMDA